MPDYEIVPVPPGASNLVESVGSKQKFWYYREDTDPTRPWLFKANRPGTGEDWAEKIAAELCTLLGLPHVDYELAQWGDTPGVISRRLDSDDETLVLGNIVLSSRYTAYPRLATETFARIREHTLSAVLDTLSSPDLAVGMPPTWAAPVDVESAADLFTGYLLLDAWIGNTDRHDKNWALVERLMTEGIQRYLAPTFDHASSLGREVTDAERLERLESRDRGRRVEAYVGRARSALFDVPTDKRPMHPVIAFQNTAAVRPEAAAQWLGRLQSVTTEAVERVVARVPAGRMTEPSRTFALRVLTLNRSALLGAAPR